MATQKFNIFVGEFVNKLTNSPTTKAISKELFSFKKKDYILINNNLSLPEIAQSLLDDIILEKKEILDILNNIFSDFEKSKYNSNFYKNLLDSNHFSSIISTNYDCILEDYFFDKINKNTPFSINNDELDKLSFYKIYGDLKKPDKFVLSTQDIKRIKLLGFYEPFWKKIEKELCKNPTVLFGINFNDTVVIKLLDFLILKTKKQHKPIYLYANSFEKSEDFEKFVKSHSINIIEGKDEDFLDTLETYFPEIKENNSVKVGDAPQSGYA